MGAQAVADRLTGSKLDQAGEGRFSFDQLTTSAAADVLRVKVAPIIVPEPKVAGEAQAAAADPSPTETARSVPASQPHQSRPVDPKLLKSLEQRLEVMQASPESERLSIRHGEGLHGHRSRAVREMQQMMMEIDREAVVSAVEQTYPGKSNAEVLKIAIDGRFGDATGIAVSRIRVKLGLSAEPVANAEFLAKLTQAKHENIDADTASKTKEDRSAPKVKGASPSEDHGPIPEKELNQAAKDASKLIRDEKSPVPVLAAVSEKYGQLGLGLLEQRVRVEFENREEKDPGTGPSLIEQMVQKKDIPPTEVAAATSILYPGRYDEAAVAEASSLYRDCRGHTSGKERSRMQSLIQTNHGDDGPMTATAEAFADLMNNEWQEDFVDREGPITAENKFRFFEYVICDEKKVLSDEQLTKHGIPVTGKRD